MAESTDDSVQRVRSRLLVKTKAFWMEPKEKMNETDFQYAMTVG